MATLKSLRPVRVFSEEVKKQVVRDIESLKMSPSEASQELSVSLRSIYNWIDKYSRYLKRNCRLVVESQSDAMKSKELKQELKEAQAALGRKQMELDYLNKLIELAGKEYGVDFKKNFSSQPSSGSASQKDNSTTTR
jgi:transposase-like protein